MLIFALVLAGLLLAWVSLLYVKLRIPGGFYFLPLKLMAGALSLWIAIAGGLGALLGALAGSATVAVVYAVLAVAAAIPAARIIGTREVLSGLFGTDPRAAAADSGRPHLLKRSWGLFMPAVPAPRLERDIPFWTPPECTRPVLCDIWQPPAGVRPSGLAYIYFHNSAWVLLDKDVMTRPLFRRLAAQGHVVMDVAYRLYPETDMAGMVADVRRAIAWMKANAARYGVDPARIVTGGSSAGGHIALLAAYTNGDPAMNPPDVSGIDTAVRGVISCYGPVDLPACWEHLRITKLQQQIKDEPDLNAPLPRPVQRLLGANAARKGFQKAVACGRLDWILNGSPETIPEQYARFSPCAYVHPGCPPTLLIQGEDDQIVPAPATNRFCQQLQAAGVPSGSLMLPQTDHAFDLALLRCSPAGYAAMWHIERFLAAMAA